MNIFALQAQKDPADLSTTRYGRSSLTLSKEESYLLTEVAGLI